MNRRWKWLLPLALLVTGALLVVACGGDDDDDAGDDGGATATATAEGNDATATVDAGNPTATEGSADPTDEPSSGNTVADACGVVTQAQVEAALGEAVQTPYITYSGRAGVGTSGAQADISTCAYIAEAGIPSLNVDYWTAPGEAAAIAEMIQLACDGKEEIPDLGDLACWYDGDHREIQLGTGTNFVRLFATTSGDSTDALLDIAGKASVTLG